MGPWAGGGEAWIPPARLTQASLSSLLWDRGIAVAALGRKGPAARRSPQGPDGRSVCRLAPGVPVSQEWTELRMPVAPRSHGWLRAKPEASLAVPTYNFAGVFDSGAGSLTIFTA